MRGIMVGVLLLTAWQVGVMASGIPGYLLPSPLQVATAFYTHAPLLCRHALYTACEIVLGLGLGIFFGAGSALLVSFYPAVRPWFIPVLVISQAIPVFALAPLLVLWAGYGLWSKVLMAALVIYFPITSTFYDGLRNVPAGWLELAETMRARKIQLYRHILIPAAMPSLASGLRLAAIFAPIGAVIGEWVGSGAGLGYLMLQANGRMQIDLMFAAITMLAALALGLYYGMDKIIGKRSII